MYVNNKNYNIKINMSFIFSLANSLLKISIKTSTSKPIITQIA